MKNEFDYAYKIYMVAARDALDYYKSSNDKMLFRLYQKYPTILDAKKELRLKDMFNCFGADQGFQSWGAYKNRMNERFHEIQQLQNKFNTEKEVYKEKKLKELWRPFGLDNPYDLYGAYDLIKPEINNIDFSNLLFNDPNLGLQSKMILGDNLSWLKISNCQFKKCIFIGIVFEFSRIKNSIFDGSFFNGIPQSLERFGNRGFIIFEKWGGDYTYFTGVEIEGCSFKNCFLHNAYMRDARFVNCDFSGAYLSTSRLSMVAEGCNFDNANLSFLDGGGHAMDIYNTTIRGANLLGSFVPIHRNIIVDMNTVFMDGTKISLKSKSILPMGGVSTSHDKLLWFKCTKKHEWQERINVFSKKPFCKICISSNFDQKETKFSKKYKFTDFPSEIDFSISRFASPLKVIRLLQENLPDPE